MYIYIYSKKLDFSVYLDNVKQFFITKCYLFVRNSQVFFLKMRFQTHLNVY